MRREFDLALHMVAADDFHEGVRAAVIDKDQAPRWRPTALAEVSDEMVERYFEPANGADLELAAEP